MQGDHPWRHDLTWRHVTLPGAPFSEVVPVRAHWPAVAAF